MSDLTQEAILAELAKLSDSKGRVMSFHDGQTIVPNSLLEQVWREAERKTEARIIKLLEDLSNPKIPMGQLHIPGYQMREVVALIKGDNK